MKEAVEKNLNSLHNINMLFEFESSSNNPKKTKKSIPILWKEGFKLLSNLWLLAKLEGKYSTCIVEYKLIT